MFIVLARRGRGGLVGRCFLGVGFLCEGFVDGCYTVEPVLGLLRRSVVSRARGVCTPLLRDGTHLGGIGGLIRSPCVGSGMGVGLVRRGHDWDGARGLGDDGQLARGNLVLDRGLKRRSCGCTARQTADRDRLDLARVNRLGGVTDDGRRVGPLTWQLDLLTGQHQVVAGILLAVWLDSKLVLGHASS